MMFVNSHEHQQRTMSCGPASGESRKPPKSIVSIKSRVSCTAKSDMGRPYRNWHPNSGYQTITRAPLTIHITNECYPNAGRLIANLHWRNPCRAIVVRFQSTCRKGLLFPPPGRSG